MELKDKDIEKIEDYLLGKLPREEEQALEQRMKNDPEFAGEVDFMRSLIMASQEKGEEKFEELREEMGLEEENPESNKEGWKQQAGEPQPNIQPSARRPRHLRILLILIAVLIITAILLIAL